RNNLEQLIKAISIIDPKRSSEINKIPKKDFTWKDLWPQLALISCWTDAQAMLWIPTLKQIAGNVNIQSKGLLSTEAVVSIPIKNMPYPSLAYHSHFFEFRDIDSGNIFLAHQLAKDVSYEVIVTTGGGLYRYATKDVVQVMDFYLQVPLLKFLGRHNRTSDLVGEKVSELQVIKIMEQILREENECLPMLFLKAKMIEGAGIYILYLEDANDDGRAKIITEKFEKMLCNNPYYSQALHARQLLPMQCKKVDKGFKKRLTKYYSEKNLIKDGDVKLPVLFLHDDLNELLFLK
ncbi:MAG: GH3 auxin-responsive promoter family protein, partial [Ginsengibacter sp.]